MRGEKFLGVQDGLYLVLSRGILSLIPFVSLPAITSLLEPEVWSKVITFQVIGSIFSSFVELSWNNSGYSRLKKSGKVDLIFISSIQRFLVFMNLSICFVLFTLIFSNNRIGFLFLGVTLSSMSYGLSNGWLWNANFENRAFLRYESVPKLLIATFPLFFIHSENQIGYYFWLIAISNLMIIGVPLLRTYKVRSKSIRLTKYFLLDIKFAFFRLVQSLYFASFLPIVALLDPGALVAFTLVERCYRFSMSAVFPISQLAVRNSNKFVTENELRIRKIAQIGLKHGFLALLVFLFLRDLRVSNLLFHTTLGISQFDQSFILLIMIVSVNRILSVSVFNANIPVKRMNRALIISCLMYLLVLGTLFSIIGIQSVIAGAIFAELTQFYFLTSTQKNSRMSQFFKNLRLIRKSNTVINALFMQNSKPNGGIDTIAEQLIPHFLNEDENLIVLIGDRQMSFQSDRVLVFRSKKYFSYFLVSSLLRTFSSKNTWINLDYFTPYSLFRPGKSFTIIHDVMPLESNLEIRKRKQLWFKIQVFRTAKVATRVVTVSNFSKSRLEYFLSSLCNIEVIQNPVDIVRFGSAEKGKSYSFGEEPYVLVFGAKWRHKNLETVVEAVKRLQSIIKVNLVVTGFMPESHAEPIVGEMNYLHYVGYVEAEVLGGLIRGAVAVLVPSVYEGYGLAAREALLLGSKVIVSDLPVYSGIDGLILVRNYHSSKEWANEILNLLQEPKGSKLKRKTPEIEFFSPLEVAKQYLALCMRY